MSKYTDAINRIGKPCSPKQIRNEVNLHAGSPDEIVTAQNCASALNNLLKREQVIRGEDGLYSTPEIAQKSDPVEPI